MDNSTQTNPTNPDEDQNLQPNTPNTEIDPGRPATDKEVDLDRSKTQTYPDKTPPERH